MNAAGTRMLLAEGPPLTSGPPLGRTRGVLDLDADDAKDL